MPVTHFDIALRRPLAGGRAFGDVGPYEELKGRLQLRDRPRPRREQPDHRRRAGAPQRDGRVEWPRDVSILLPDRPRPGQRPRAPRRRQPRQHRGGAELQPRHAPRLRARTAIRTRAIDVGDGFLMRRGWVVISCGWQCDVPELPGLFRLHGAGGARRRGPTAPRARLRRSSRRPSDVPHFLLSDRGHLAYRAADLEEREAVLTGARPARRRARRSIPRERWRFARVDDGRVVADSAPRLAGRRLREGPALPGRLHRRRRARDGARPGGAARRVSWLKHGTAAEGNPAPGALRWAYAYGRSQTGRLLRTLRLLGREPRRGGTRGVRRDHRQRRGRHARRVQPALRPELQGPAADDGPLFPFTDEPATDAVTKLTDALHARLDARGSRLKVFYTNTSAEYHRGDASLIAHRSRRHPRRRRTGPNVRVYHFAGTEHGARRVAAQPTRRRPRPIRTGWVERAAESPRRRELRPPAPRLPRQPRSLGDRGRGAAARAAIRALDDGTAVPPEPLAKAFDAHPRRALPAAPRAAAPPGLRRRRRAARDGPDAAARGPAFGTLVSAVDADGNEVAGIVLPELARAAGHPHRLEPAPPRHRRRRAAPGLRRRHAAVPAHARGARGVGRPARARSRSATPRARRTSGACAAPRRRWSPSGYLLEEDVELSRHAGRPHVGRGWSGAAR